MKKTELSDNMVLYIFVEEKKTTPGNILAVIDGPRAWIVDTSYERHMRQVMKDLAAQHIGIESAILSHKHEDHIDGVKALKDVRIMAGEAFLDDEQDHLKPDPFLRRLKPHTLLPDKQKLEFGGFQFQFVETRGHACSGITTIINESTIHVGDMVFYATDGRLSLPYIDSNSTVGEMITGLTTIRNMEADVLVPGHGEPVTGRERIRDILNDLIQYLTAITESRGTRSAAECLPENMRDCALQKFHQNNLLRF